MKQKQKKGFPDGGSEQLPDSKDLFFFFTLKWILLFFFLLYSLL